MFGFVIGTPNWLASRMSYGRFLYFVIRYNIVPVTRTKQSISEINFTQSNYFSSKSMKVAVLGAASKTGNCLSLFLKQSSMIDELTIYDIKPIDSLSLDLNYVDTKCKVKGYNCGENQLKETLDGAKVVMIVADRKIAHESNSREAMKHNAEILSDLLPSIIQNCPQAMVAIAMNPTNSLVPLTMEMYKKAGIYNPNRIFGVMSASCVRANTFAAEVIGIEPEVTMVPIIGGACPKTCVPLFSQAKPCNRISEQEARKLTHAVRTADDEISKLSKSAETPCYTMAFGAARFCMSLCKALRHQSGVVECAYVRSCLIPELTYFAAPLDLGPDGVQRHLDIPPLNDYECVLLKAAIPRLKEAIALGEAVALGEENISTEVCPQPDKQPCMSSPPMSQSST